MYIKAIIRSDSDEDHTRALNAGINDPPKKWKRPHGRPRQTIAPSRMTSNNGLWSALHRAYDREQWCEIVEMATLLQGHAT